MLVLASGFLPVFNSQFEQTATLQRPRTQHEGRLTAPTPKPCRNIESYAAFGPVRLVKSVPPVAGMRRAASGTARTATGWRYETQRQLAACLKAYLPFRALSNLTGKMTKILVERGT